MSKVAVESQRKIAKIEDDIWLEKVKQAENKKVGETHNTRKSEILSKRLGIQADTEGVKLRGDTELKKHANLAVEKLQIQTAILGNDLTIQQQNLGASDTRVKLNDASIKASLTIESVKLAESQENAANLLEDFKLKYGQAPKIEASRVTVSAASKVS
jgi:hypothetical protein